MNIFELLKVNKELFAELPYLGRKGQYHFYFSPDFSASEELTRLLADPAVKTDQIFPTRRRRQVCTLRTASGEEVLVKKFFLYRHWKECFAHKNVAYRETIQQLNFSSCPFLTPEIYGYYERRIAGLPVECGIVMQFLKDFRKITPEEYGRIPEVMIALYEKGLFHGDFSARNTLIHNTTGEIALIDFDLAQNVPAGSLHHLIRMGGLFLFAARHTSPELFNRKGCFEFISQLYGLLPGQEKEKVSAEDFQDAVFYLASSPYPWGGESVKHLLEEKEFFRP